MKDFTELKFKYRARLDFPNGSSFVSNDSFDDYEVAYNYAKEESKKYGFCGFCVVDNFEPELQLSFLKENFNEVI